MCKVDKYNMGRRVDVGLLGCWSVADAAREKPGGITMRLVWRKGCGDKKRSRRNNRSDGFRIMDFSDLLLLDAEYASHFQRTA